MFHDTWALRTQTLLRNEQQPTTWWLWASTHKLNVPRGLSLFVCCAQWIWILRTRVRTVMCRGGMAGAVADACCTRPERPAHVSSLHPSCRCDADSLLAGSIRVIEFDDTWRAEAHVAGASAQLCPFFPLAVHGASMTRLRHKSYRAAHPPDPSVYRYDRAKLK